MLDGKCKEFDFCSIGFRYVNEVFNPASNVDKDAPFISEISIPKISCHCYLPKQPNGGN